MKVPFKGKWRGTVTGRNAAFSQRIVISNATSGNGAYNGVVGNSFVFENGEAELQWNNDSGSGWQESAIISSIGMTSPLVVVTFISADDNFPANRDGDYDDLQVSFEHLDAPFEVLQRPFSLDRGTLVMMPDGVFDTSQGVQYMGVRIRNTWFFDWQSAFPATGMKIGVAPASRAALAAAGVNVIDTWSPQEQEAFSQTMDSGFVRVPDLLINEETMVYFKVNVTNASASKPEVGFVAQRDAFDPHFDAPTRVVHKKIFISQSSYDKTNKELVVSVPEGTLRLKLSSIILDLKAANDAAKDLIKCLKTGRGDGGGGGSGGGHDGACKPCDCGKGPIGAWWESFAERQRICKERGAKVLRAMIEAVLAGKNVDICLFQKLFQLCCQPPCEPCCCQAGGKDQGGSNNGYPGGGWQDGAGKDGWCRVKPVAWLPVSFEYRIEPNPAYTGQFGPLAFEDPWWKVILIIIAILLAIASLIYDYVEAGQDPNFIIGKILRNGDANTNKVDCAVCDLNGSRGVDFGELDAQGDDVNNGLPIVAIDTIIQLDRSDNGDNGILDAVLGNVVWKSGGRSGTTRGVVTNIAFATNVNYETEDTISGTINFTNQVHVGQITGMEQPLSQGGDSGSVWVDMASGRPVALNFAGDIPDAGTDGIGNPIRQVIDQLNLRFNP
jgi:hypothetical protein